MVPEIIRGIPKDPPLTFRWLKRPRLNRGNKKLLITGVYYSVHGKTKDAKSLGNPKKNPQEFSNSILQSRTVIDQSNLNRSNRTSGEH